MNREETRTIQAVLPELLWDKFNKYREENGYKRPELLREILRMFFNAMDD